MLINKQQKVIFAAAHRSFLRASLLRFFQPLTGGDLIFLPILASWKEASTTFATSPMSAPELSRTTTPGSACLRRWHSAAPSQKPRCGSLLSPRQLQSYHTRAAAFASSYLGFSDGLLTSGAALFWEAGAELCLLSVRREALRKEGHISGWHGRGYPLCAFALGTAMPVLGEDREAQAEGSLPEGRG